MNKIKESLIKIKFINNPKFIELEEGRRNVFCYKYDLVYKNLPVMDKLSIKNRANINNGLLDAINNETSSYISHFYLDYTNRVLETPSGKVCKNLLYKDFFDSNNYDDLLGRLYLFVKYIFHSAHPRNLIDDNDKALYNLLLNIRNRINYHELPDKKYKEFYYEVLLYMVSYFVMYEDLINNMNLFDEICNFFEDHIEFLYNHYTSNYQDKYRYIPEDLFHKYNNGLVKKMII